MYYSLPATELRLLAMSYTPVHNFPTRSHGAGDELDSREMLQCTALAGGEQVDAICCLPLSSQIIPQRVDEVLTAAPGERALQCTSALTSALLLSTHSGT